MSDTITISEEARKAADFLQPVDSRFGRDYVEQQIQVAVNTACADKDKRIAEARNLIKHFGWTSCEDTAVIMTAEKWLEGKP